MVAVPSPLLYQLVPYVLSSQERRALLEVPVHDVWVHEAFTLAHPYCPSIQELEALLIQSRSQRDPLGPGCYECRQGPRMFVSYLNVPGKPLLLFFSLCFYS